MVHPKEQKQLRKTFGKLHSGHVVEYTIQFLPDSLELLPVVKLYKKKVQLPLDNEDIPYLLPVSFLTY
jgi:hypothetical protein